MSDIIKKKKKKRVLSFRSVRAVVLTLNMSGEHRTRNVGLNFVFVVARPLGEHLTLTF